jgi:major membrane immunogen (membrane-anchored lipoprotein)
MKNIIIIGIMAASILLTGCGKKAADDAKPPQRIYLLAQTKKDVAASRVVCYAIAKPSKTRNMVFTITEIWKGSEDGSALGITNGTQIESEYPSTDNIPEAAIVLFPQGGSPSGQRSMIWVRQGQVSDLPVQEFKTKIGL